MPRPPSVSSASHQPAVNSFSRLDSILASAEQALARAEEQLRRAQQAHIRSAPQFTFKATVVERHRPDADRH